MCQQCQIEEKKYHICLDYLTKFVILIMEAVFDYKKDVVVVSKFQFIKIAPL